MDDEGQSHERPSRDEEPRRSDRKTKSARVESPEEEVEDSTPQIPTVKDINKMMNIFARHTRAIEKKMERLENEVSRTSEAQQMLVA